MATDFSWDRICFDDGITRNVVDVFDDFFTEGNEKSTNGNKVDEPVI